MPDLVAFLLCGFSAGLLGGYLGLGGGEIIIPILTVVIGIDIKAAIPVSVVAVRLLTAPGTVAIVRLYVADA